MLISIGHEVIFIALRKKPLFWHIELIVRGHFKLCHKTKTKDITAVNQNQGKYHKEQMRILSKAIKLLEAGKTQVILSLLV